MLPMTPFQRGELWDHFADALIAIDLQKMPPKDLERIRDTLFDLSAGLPAIAKLVWRLSQYQGLFLEGMEQPEDSNLDLGQITPELMKMAAQRGLGLVEGMLTAIRNRDYKKISELTDVAENKVHAYLAQSQSDLNAAEARVLRTAAVADALIDVDIPKIEAEEYARDVTAGDESSPVPELIRRAVAMYEKAREEQDTKTKPVAAKSATPARKSTKPKSRSPKAASPKAARSGGKTSIKGKSTASKK
jgi:hypothetical protein